MRSVKKRMHSGDSDLFCELSQYMLHNEKIILKNPKHYGGGSLLKVK